jgi:hypothetical protein
MMTPPTPSFRNFDQALSCVPVNEGAFGGHWINTSRSALGWRSLRTEFQGDVPLIQAALADGNGVEFSDVTFYGGISGPELTAFSAIVEDEGSQILLQGNLNLGLLVLATFKVPMSGGTGYFSREFFARSRPSDPRVAPGSSAESLFEQLLQPASVGEDALLGRWCSADLQTRGVSEITIAYDGSGVTARALGAPLPGSDSPIDWGIADVGIFACLDEAGHPSLSALASWEFDCLETQLQLRVPAGTLAVAGFNRFSDGRMNYSTREFFYRLSQ